MEIASENLIYWVFLLIVILFAAYYIFWLIVASAVKKGVSDLTNLIKKDLELKGVSKEEIEKLCLSEEPK